MSIGRMRYGRKTLVAAIATIGIFGVNGPAHAEDATELTPGTVETSSVTFSTRPTDGAEDTIREAYSDASAPTKEARDVKADFVDQAQDSGLYYDPKALDYLSLQLTDDAAKDAEVDQVEMVVPEDFQVKEVTLDEAEVTNNDGQQADSVSAGVTGSSVIDSTDVMLPDGPGFASFTPSGSGQYILKTSKGQMLATWAKTKLADDKDAKYDYWQYSRKAKVTSTDITGLNWLINSFGTKSYPASTNPMHHWVDWEPSTGQHSGDCKGAPLQMQVGYAGASISTSFQDCDRYTAYMRDEFPGDFSVGWEPSKLGKADPLFFGTTDPRETAFSWVAARLQPKATDAANKLTVNDYQWFRMQSQWNGSKIQCEATNTGANC